MDLTLRYALSAVPPLNLPEICNMLTSFIFIYILSQLWTRHRIYLAFSPAPSSIMASETPTAPKTREKSVLFGEESWQRYVCAEISRDQSASRLIKTPVEVFGSRVATAILAKTDRLWKNGTTLKYGFMLPPELPTETIQKMEHQKAKVNRVVHEWTKYAYIAFNFVEDVTMATIRISFLPGRGSMSYIGTEVASVPVEEPTMNIGRINGESDVLTPEETSVILHELGHTLGMVHEHKSSMVGGNVKLSTAAVNEYYRTGFQWSEATTGEQVLSIYNEQDVTNFIRVDPLSIIRYFMPSEMNEQNTDVTPSTELSIYDKAFAAINYPSSPKAPHPSSSVTGLMPSCETGEKFGTNSLGGVQKPASPPNPPQALNPQCPCRPWKMKNFHRGLNVVACKKKSKLPLRLVGHRKDSTEATKYRKDLVRGAFREYSRRVNLRILELTDWDATDPDRADVRIFFGPIPLDNVPGWSIPGRVPLEHRRTVDAIKAEGGDALSTTVLSSSFVPKMPFVVGPGLDDAADEEALEALLKVQTRTIYHELGHVFGLQHEHESPFTKTADKPVATASAVTWFDEDSVMLYPGHKFKSATKWEAFKRWFDPKKPKFNTLPSKTDLALLGVNLFHLPAAFRHTHPGIVDPWDFVIVRKD
ncbi:hypothetical protein M413DRAFT_29749 [Hebeloma cylindrosporum]|uniref:Peptidase M12A domain-containing protein n=1 Tax=Hebeloma cylindrosporum TaxID=76867 RepID=A0A0C3C3E3_HEBCY|nr:hypothetical protein M413DRAFT_29749 [Hebeloma cylindrosporum h7]